MDMDPNKQATGEILIKKIKNKCLFSIQGLFIRVCINSKLNFLTLLWQGSWFIHSGCDSFLKLRLRQLRVKLQFYARTSYRKHSSIICTSVLPFIWPCGAKFKLHKSSVHHHYCRESVLHTHSSPELVRFFKY